MLDDNESFGDSASVADSPKATQSNLDDQTIAWRKFWHARTDRSAMHVGDFPVGYRSTFDAGWDAAVAAGFRRPQQVETVESDWEYGYNTGSTVSRIGDRAQIEAWAAALGTKVGYGDQGSRIMRRRRQGDWQPVEESGVLYRPNEGN